MLCIATLRQPKKFAELQQRGACNMDLSKYSLDICIQRIFSSQRGSVEALNFPIIMTSHIIIIPNI